MTHELKIIPEYFEDVICGRKTFEIRFDDRGYAVGDLLVLKEYRNGGFTGRRGRYEVTYIYRGDGAYGIPEGVCVMAIRPERPTLPRGTA